MGNDDDCADSSADTLYAAAVAVGRAHVRVNESLGNEPGCIENLVRLKRELHDAALEYAFDVNAFPERAERLNGKNGK